MAELANGRRKVKVITVTRESRKECMLNETVQSEIFSYVAFSTVAWLETGRLPVRISVTTAEFCQQNNVLRGRWSLSIQIIQGDSTLVCMASHTRQLVPGDLGD